MVPHRCLHNVGRILYTQKGPNPGAEYGPVPLHGPTLHLELDHHCQKPAGGKAPQPHSSMDTTICEPADPHSQALFGAGSISTLLPGSKSKPPPAYQ